MEDNRFSKLQFPIDRILPGMTAPQLMEAVPKLKLYFNKPLTQYARHDQIPMKFMAIPIDMAKLIRYIIILYDPNSPLGADFPDDLTQRKEAACREAGFNREPGTGDWSEDLQAIMQFKDDVVNDWILDFFKVLKNPTWTALKLVDEEIEAVTRNRVYALKDGNIRTDMMKQMKTLQEERETLLIKFYAEHRDLQEATEKQLFPISPENIFYELPESQEAWKMKQVTDVPTATGV